MNMKEMVIILRIIALLMSTGGVLLLFMMDFINNKKILLLGGALAMSGVLGFSALTFVEKEFLNINREKEEIVSEVSQNKMEITTNPLKKEKEMI